MAKKSKVETIVALAKANGYTVTEASGRVSIVKRHARTGAVIRGVVINDNGTGFDVMVRADAARCLRSVEQFKAVLKIN